VEGGTLYVCAVPIGNLGDASTRLREVLRRVDAIACEDTRSTAKLLDLLGIERPHPRLLQHHAHNERASSGGILALLQDGSDVALVSDAGTPGVRDPGVALVDRALGAGVRVEAVAGPSAVTAALSIAGIEADGFRFVGFFPRKGKELAELAKDGAGDLLVGFESPNRVVATLRGVAEVQPSRYVVVARELTKQHEEVLRGSPEVLADELAARPGVKGEFVLLLAPMVVSGAARAAGADARAGELVDVLVEHGLRRKDASRIAAEFLGGTVRELYEG
jgi:16S rRNA (cytidine1402-2'-O)-methyltransferase